MKLHPACEWFPPLGDDELKALAHDIKANGLIEPIVTYDGAILDGRIRFRACELAGVKPRFTAWVAEKDVDPIAWVISKNLHRRHLSESQRAMVAARLREHFESAAKQRQREGGRIGGEGGGKLSANLREPSESKSAAKAAEALKVSPRSVEAASKVTRDGAPELVAAVVEGKAKVSAAAQVAHLPKEKQAEIVSSGKVAEAAKGVREAKKASAEVARNRQPAMFLEDVGDDDDVDEPIDCKPLPPLPRDVAPEIDPLAGIRELEAQANLAVIYRECETKLRALVGRLPQQVRVQFLKGAREKTLGHLVALNELDLLEPADSQRPKLTVFQGGK
jgi:ParB-like chromosome segregation protein Spo0J